MCIPLVLKEMTKAARAEARNFKIHLAAESFHEVINVQEKELDVLKAKAKIFYIL